MNIFQQVKVTKEGHNRHGQAGTVQAIDPKKPETVGVRFDTDGVLEAVEVADLQVLG